MRKTRTLTALFALGALVSCADRSEFPLLADVPPQPLFAESDQEREAIARELERDGEALEAAVARIAFERGDAPAPTPPPRRPPPNVTAFREAAPAFSTNFVGDTSLKEGLSGFLTEMVRPTIVNPDAEPDRLDGRGLEERARTWIDGPPAPCPTPADAPFVALDMRGDRAPLSDAIARCGRRDVVIVGVGPTFELAAEQARAAEAAWDQAAAGRILGVRMARAGSTPQARFFDAEDPVARPLSERRRALRPADEG